MVMVHSWWVSGGFWFLEGYGQFWSFHILSSTCDLHIYQRRATKVILQSFSKPKVVFKLSSIISLKNKKKQTFWMKMMSQWCLQGQWRFDLQIFNQNIQKPVGIGLQGYISYGFRIITKKPKGVKSLRFVLIIW